jgi:hypothetical protein
MSKRLEPYFPILFRGSNGQCAHEFIIDLRPFKKLGVTEEVRREDGREEGYGGRAGGRKGKDPWSPFHGSLPW